MKTIYHLFLILMTVSFMACEDDLPKPTQKGDMMMAAKINGKAWQHNGVGGTLTSGDIHVNYGSGGNLQILGKRVDDHFNNSVSLNLIGLTSTGKYTLEDKASDNYGTLYDYTNTRNRFETTAAVTGTVTITRLDTQNKIISGTFHFRGQNIYNPADFVEVTDGRFDVKY